MNANKSKNGPPTETNDYSSSSGMDVGENVESDWKKVADNFNEMNLKEELLRGISVYGFEKLSVIQQHVILPCIKGDDVIAQAQSGSGKLATFSISILQQIDTSLNECQALILTPTHELALQIQKVVIALGNFMKANCHACIGKTNVYDNMHKRRKIITRSHVVVGTPDHVYDMIVRKSLLTQFIKIFVLDEADEILSRGFKDQIKKVFRCLEKDIQVIILSATMSEDVLNVSTHFMHNPIRILGQKAVTKSDKIANQKKVAEYVRKILRNDLPKEIMEWPLYSLSVKISQQEFQDIIIGKSAITAAIKLRYAKQMEKLSVCEQHERFWFKKYKTLINHINTTRDKLKRLIIEPDPSVINVRNVGTTVCPSTILKETTLL